MIIKNKITPTEITILPDESCGIFSEKEGFISAIQSYLFFEVVASNSNPKI
jgi:hypothetical protein